MDSGFETPANYWRPCGRKREASPDTNGGPENTI